MVLLYGNIEERTEDDIKNVVFANVFIIVDSFEIGIVNSEDSIEDSIVIRFVDNITVFINNGSEDSGIGKSFEF